MLLTIIITLMCIGDIQAQNNNSGSLGITILLGSGSIIGSGIYDIISAPKSVRIYNDNLVALNLRNQLHKKTWERAPPVQGTGMPDKKDVPSNQLFFGLDLQPRP